MGSAVEVCLLWISSSGLLVMDQQLRFACYGISS